MIWVVVTHSQQRCDKPLLQIAIKVRPRRKHTMVVWLRRPYLTKPTCGHQAFASYGIPERTTDRAGVGTPVEHGAHHFNFTGARITMFADIAVETQRLVLAPLTHPLLLQKVNGENRGVSTVSAAESERTTFQIRDCGNGTSRDRYDFGHPAYISVAHGDRPTGVPAPLIRLQVRQVCIPGDIDARR